MLKHEKEQVRAKCCNLLGNLSRHSDFFYDSFLENKTLVTELIKCLKDSSPQTRKFACYAVGNAGFHNSKLYSVMIPSIPGLIICLSDKEDKTKANAAGALGNLVRNSAELVDEMINCGVLNELVKALKKSLELQNVSPSSASAGSNSQFSGGSGNGNGSGSEDNGSGNSKGSKKESSLKIFLFAIGNFCSFKKCVKELSKMGFDALIAEIAKTNQKDLTIQKYISRIEEKKRTGEMGNL